MHTFSAGLQSVTVDGQAIRLEANSQGYETCRLVVNDKQVATFSRNGMLISVEDVPPPPPPAKTEGAAADAHAATASHQDPPKGKSK